MQKHLSVPIVKNLQPAEKPYEVVDDELKGFLARVQPSGVVTFYLSYRNQAGLKSRYRIGRHPGITVPAARKAAEKIAGKVIQGEDPHNQKKLERAKTVKAKKETLGGFIENQYKKWALTHQKRGNETIILLESNFKHLYSTRMSKVTAWDIQKWRSDKTKSGLAPSTINRRVATLKAVINKAVEWDVIESNPLQKVKPLKVDKKSRVRYLSVDEEARLREALKGREEDIRLGRESGNDWRNKRGYVELSTIEAAYADHLQPMVLLSLNTGMRRGEVFNLKWQDVDFGKRQLTVEGTTSKSGQTRHISLNSEVWQVLKAWSEQKDGEYVFVSPVSGYRFDNIKTSWSLLRDRAGLSDFRFHDLRHTFASKLVMAGINLYTIKELMGHSTIQMTERYAHLAPAHRASAVEALVSKIT